MTNPFKGWIYADAYFWIGTFDRTARTFFQTLLATIGADYSGLLQAGWVELFVTSSLAAFVALLTCLATPNYVTYQQPDAPPRHARQDNETAPQIF